MILQKTKKKESQLKSILYHYRIRINNSEININDNSQYDSIKSKISENNFENFEEELLDIGIEDQDALDLIKNLLKIDPSQRFSAEQALNSKYLTQFKDNFTENVNGISFKTNDYNRFCKAINSKNEFDMLRLMIGSFLDEESEERYFVLPGIREGLEKQQYYINDMNTS